MLEYVTISKFAELSGYSAQAIRHKIYNQVWEEGKVWIKAKDNRILISIIGFNCWVEESMKKPNRKSTNGLSGCPPPLV